MWGQGSMHSVIRMQKGSRGKNVPIYVVRMNNVLTRWTKIKSKLRYYPSLFVLRQHHLIIVRKEVESSHGLQV